MLLVVVGGKEDMEKQGGTEESFVQSCHVVALLSLWVAGCRLLHDGCMEAAVSLSIPREPN